MQYTRVDFLCTPNTDTVREVLTALLAEIGFDAFWEDNTRLEAYIRSSLFSADQIEAALDEFPMEASISYTVEVMEDKNWNEEWEKNYFQPIYIDNRLCIYSSFHKPVGEYEYRIMIDPKMSFGTGHHQTTVLMLEELLAMNLTGKNVLDMGCGTAVLAILASMKGASEVTAIDIDEWAYRNALENVQRNGVHNIHVKMGGAEQLIENTRYDVILANINRNILLADIPRYALVLKERGKLVVSGFYREDIPALQAVAEEAGLMFQHASEKEKWASASFCYS